MADEFEATLTLVKRAKTGDAAALDALFRKYQTRVHFLARARLGPGLRKHVDSMDILQEAMLRGFKGFERFEMRREGAFVHWLGKLVENAIRDKADFFAAQKRSVLEAAPLHDEHGEPRSDVFSRVPSPDPTPSMALERDEKLSALDAALQRLSAEHREAILQRELADLSFKEIGQNMERSEDAARMLYARAKAELVRELGG